MAVKHDVSEESQGLSECKLCDWASSLFDIILCFYVKTTVRHKTKNH